MEPEYRAAKKRTPDEIILPKPKKLKTNDSKRLEALALIEHILEQRGSLRHVAPVQSSRFDATILTHLPPSSHASDFLPLTNFAGDRLYLKLSPVDSFEDSARNLPQSSVTPMTNEDIWLELEKERERRAEEAKNAGASIEPAVARLWTDAYKPSKYKDLLSEEHTNRELLRWLKLWDAFVFKKSRPVGARAARPSGGSAEAFFEQDKADRRPRYKLVLLCGPPGVGKTSLAHVVARHAGYTSVEVNASEERTLDTFRNLLVNATTNASVHRSTPTCLIFDEIDGAPAASVDFLVRFASDQYGRPAKGSATHQRTIKLQRPIICVCNNAYATALRSLRQAALMLHVGAQRERAAGAGGSRLLVRLAEIADKEGVRISRSALMTMVERSGHDVRACINNLQFRGSGAEGAGCGKDAQRTLFQFWEQVFYVGQRGGRGRNAELAGRWRAIEDARRGIGSGEFDKLAGGVFENYANLFTGDIGARGAGVGSLEDALDWFSITDVWNRHIHETQQYAMSPYLTYAFVMWHFVFAALPNVRGSFENGVFRWESKRIQYPRVGLEVHQARQKSDGILKQILRFMSPSISSQYASPKTTLQLDVLPMLHRLLANPALRPVDMHLFTPKERATLALVVNVMIDYGLNYLQERGVDGSYTFRMDPNFEELVKFTGVRPAPAPDVRYQSKALALDSTRQLIAHEIGVEKMRRMAHLTKAPMLAPPPCQRHSGGESDKSKKLNYFVVEPRTRRGEDAGDQMEAVRLPADRRSKGIFFHYKEGHTNAVKRSLLISELRL